MCKQQLLKVKKIPPSNVETRREQYGSFQICLQSLHKCKCLVAGAGLQPSNVAACQQTYGNDHDAVVQEPKPNEGQRIVQQHCGRETNISPTED